MRDKRLLQGRIHGWQQKLGKGPGVLGDEELRMELCQVIGTLQIEDLKLEERNQPTLTPSITMGQMEENRTSSIAVSRGRMPLPQSTGGGLQRAAGDRCDHHTEGGAKEEKRALPLLREARKALETASAWALALLERAWKVLGTASSGIHSWQQEPGKERGFLGRRISAWSCARSPGPSRSRTTRWRSSPRRTCACWRSGTRRG